MRGSVGTASSSKRWIGRVDKYHRSRRTQISRRPKCHCIVEILGRTVHPVAFSAIEGQFFSIHGEEISTKEDSEMLKNISESQATNNRKVVPDRMLALRLVDDEGNNDQQEYRPQRKDEEVAEEFKNAVKQLQRSFTTVMYAS